MSRLTQSMVTTARRLAQVLLWGWSVSVWAAPDAGSLLQQLEARPAGNRVAPQLKTPQVPTPPAAETGGAVVRVNAFRFEGQTLLGPEDLHAALKGFTERDLSLTQLQEAAWVIVQSYREAGWLAHALVPEQEIEGGVVTLRVIEARLGQVRTEFPEGTKLPRQHIEAMAQAHLAQGQPINLNQLDRLILLLGDLPGVVANASFVQGKLDLSTDVRIAISPSKALDANLTTDNFGAISTGRTRISANILASNPADLGDALQLQGVATDGSRYGRLAYSWPVGLQGIRAGLHASDMRYRLVGSFAALQASGSAQTWGLDLTAPWVRQSGRNLNVQLNTDHKRFDNLALANVAATEATTVSNYRIDVLRAGLSGHWIDTLLTPAQNTLGLQASWGKVDLRHSPNAGADALAAHTAGAFSKLNVNFSREHNLTDQTTAYLQAGAQWANRNLDSSEKLYLGGASSVRAYPSSEAGGTSGTTATVGLRHRINDAFSWNAFADWGRVQVYKNNTSASGHELINTNTQTLKGAGVSVNWRSPQGHEVSATWSRRLGANPAAHPTTGADNDGTFIVNRWWLSATLNF